MWVLIVVVLVLALALVSGQYRLAALQNQYQLAWAEVETQLRERHNWVSHWVQIAKTVVLQEQSSLKTVIEARQAAMRALKNLQHQPEQNRSMQEWLRSEAEFTQSLRDLRAFVQTTPELLAHPDLVPLRADLRQIELQLLSASEQYNKVCSQYNLYRRGFPHNGVAKALGYTQDALLLPIDKTVAFKDAHFLAEA